MSLICMTGCSTQPLVNASVSVLSGGYCHLHIFKDHPRPFPLLNFN